MIYTLIISILIEKPFYLLRPQSFSFQSVSEIIDTFVKFPNHMSRGWGGLSLGEWFWMKLIAALMCTVAGPDHNPRGGGQLPNPNECNSTLTSATRDIYPYPYI